MLDYKSSIKKMIYTLVFSVGILTIAQTTAVYGLSGSQFKAGNIIDDAIFYNSYSMTTDQIQAFLSSKVPSCDTNGNKIYSGSTTRAEHGTSKGYPPPYTCIKDYMETIPSITNGGSDLCKNSIAGGTKSAAQIIFDASKACDINPQVLIVMLQKEQSLISDDWPWSSQYRIAMGYGCPDPPPGQPLDCNDEYYGFFNQVYQAAKAFRRYEANPNGFNYKKHRNNFIYYSPATTSCPNPTGSNVYIQNQATASLYIYTPYQPNQSALDNLYGSGDGCGAYGNRNFWRMFSDWFGPTTGSLIRTETSNSLYYTDGSRKHTIPSMIIANEFGLGLNDVRFVSQQEIDAIPNATTPYNSSIGRLVKTPDASTIYLVSAGYKFPISSWSSLENFGFGSEDIVVMSGDAISRLVTSPENLSDVVVGFANTTVYKIENSKKRIIFEISKLNELLASSNLSKVSDYTLENLGHGIPLVDNDYLVANNSSTVRIYNGTSYYPVNSIDTYNCLGLKNIKKFTVASFSMTNGIAQNSANCLVKKSSGNTYIMNGASKYPLATGHGLQPSKLSDTIINKLPDAILKPVIKNAGGNSLAVLENGALRSMVSYETFSKLGYDLGDISEIPSIVFMKIPGGPLKFAPGDLLKSATNSSIYVVSGATSRLGIESANRFEDFGYIWNSVHTVNSQTLAAYANSGNLPAVYKNATNVVFVADDGILHTASSTIASEYGFTPSSLTQLDPLLARNMKRDTSLTRFIKTKDSTTIYYIAAGQKRPIKSWGSLVNLGGENKIKTLSNDFVGLLTTGTPI